MFQMIGVFAQFERAVLVERTKAGIQEARKRGAQIGRKNLLTPRQAEDMLQTVRTTDLSIAKIARAHGISKTAFYNYCPGGREGLLERDEAAARLAEIDGGGRGSSLLAEEAASPS